jgi:Tol biopolymer transport system component
MAATVAILAAGLGLVFDGPATSETPGVTQWISRPAPALPVGPTPGTSAEPALSADGTVLAFSSTSPNLVAPATTGLTREIFVYDSRRPATAPLERVSLTSDGRPGAKGDSSHPSVSATGRFVAFASDAALDPADTDETSDVYVRDRSTATTELVSGAVTEGPSGVTVTEPSISADGRYVALTVTEVALSRQPPSQVVVFDRVEQAVQVASHAPGKLDVVGDADSFAPAVSADGSVVVFVSAADNLDDRGESPFTRVMAWTRADDTVRAVSVAAGLASLGGLPDGNCGPPAVSADGTRVAYACLATNLLGGFPPPGANIGPNVFVTDRVSTGTVLVSVAVEPECSDCPPPTTEPPCSDCPPPTTEPPCSDCPPPTTEPPCSDCPPPTTEPPCSECPPSTSLAAAKAVSGSRVLVAAAEDLCPCLGRVSISGDGQYVAYASEAYNLVAERDNNEAADIFVRNLTAAMSARVSVTTTGDQVNDGAASAPSISAEGRWVGFVSTSVDLADADCEPLAADCPPDVFLRDRTTENSSPPTIPPAPVGVPTMVVEPGVVPSGRVATAVGSGFPSSTELVVTVDDTIPPITVTTSATGTFRAAIVIPHGVLVGPRLATARIRNRAATAAFLVVRPTSDVAILVEGRRQLGG